MVLTAQELEAIMPDATQLESDEPEMESSQHYTQLMLLVICLEWLWRNRNDYFIGARLSIYYSRQQLKARDFHGPDFFLVKQTQKQPRNSWVVWEENGKYPNLIIELLSDSTARVDRNLKKQLYQDNFRTPEYFWFDPETMEFMGFRLQQNRYEEIQPNQEGWRWSQELELYLGVDGGELRYFTAKGERVPTPQESAIQAQLQVQQAQNAFADGQQVGEQTGQQKAKQEAVPRLLKLGLSLEAIAESLDLPLSVVQQIANSANNN
ncbi:Uma2 family endonuclease [Okeania hirsuta]|uniref:Uma2 family endonuclease n=2 Tax=Okeania hirsuta TaxID=1458930 RepID=A0A3N6QSA1_9CYAN|nr:MULTISPECIES: Uma2 family endonuclease [Okeania]NET80351.1 Uma2 family endonuclease [Okeania sp. SIO1F9]RQH18903.1 Uma2 family endonuclease [Okeania hirsuta]